MNGLNPTTHRLRALRLMRRCLRCQTYCRMHLLDRRLHRLLQPRTVTQHQQTFTGLTPGLTDRGHRLTRSLLQGNDVRLNVAGGALSLARQRPHFIGYHSKPATGLARTRGFDGRVQRQQVGLLGNPVNHRQHHFNLLTLLRQPLDDFCPGVDLPGQRLDQAADFRRGPRVFIRGRTNVHHLLQGCLHGMTFRLGFVSHLRQRTQALGHFIALHARRFIGPGIAQGHRADFHTGTLSYIARFAYDRLQLIHKAIDRRGHVANFVLTVDLHALGQVTLARRQVVHGSDEQFQAVDHPTTQHHREQQQHTATHKRQAHADAPAQSARRFLNSAGGVGLHFRGRGLRRLQARAHRGCAIGCGALEAVAHQLITAGDQRREAFVQGRQIGFHRGGRDAHQDLADFHAVRIDRGFQVIDRRIVLRRIQHLVQRPFALAFFQKGFVDRVFPVEVARQMLPRRVVVDHE